MSNDYLINIVEILRKNLDHLDAIILFGSRARGDWRPWSDYDLLIIAEFREKYLDRIGKIFNILKDIRIPIEPHPYTLEEALELLRNGNPTIIDAIEEGKILFITDRGKKLYEEFKRLRNLGLKRTKTTIIIPR